MLMSMSNITPVALMDIIVLLLSCQCQILHQVSLEFIIKRGCDSNTTPFELIDIVV